MATRLLKYGCRGEDVRHLQDQLNERLGGGLTVDGIFGVKTKGAVNTFQASHNLKVDGIVGPLTQAVLDGGEDPKPVVFKKPWDLKQYDARWKSIMYSNHGDKKQTIGSSGCGPTSMSDVAKTLYDDQVLPPDLCKKSLEWGNRTYSDGTAWKFFANVKEKLYGCKMVQTGYISNAKACIDAGGYVVCSMKAGYWTSGGHFICMWKYEGGYIYCNDPASSTRTRQNETDFKSQCKGYFCFYPKVTA